MENQKYNSSDEEDELIEDEIEEEGEAAAKDEDEATQELKQMSIIQLLFDSQLKRKFEQTAAQKSAGLSVFKATGNPMQDAFRRMIEKKMLERVQDELAKRQEQQDALEMEVRRRTALRERALEEERARMHREFEVRLQTAVEAKQAAETQAKTVTVPKLVEAASSTGVVAVQTVEEAPSAEATASAPAQMDPAQIIAKVNQMLANASQPPLTEAQMRAFDLVWADPSAKLGLQAEELKAFSERLLGDGDFRQSKVEELRELFLKCDKEGTGILQEEDAKHFITQALQLLTGKAAFSPNEVEAMNWFHAVQSLEA